MEFISQGFTVLAPLVSKVKSEENGYVIFESDDSDNPKIIEKNSKKQCMEADVIFVSDVDGYIGKTVMFELGYLLSNNKEIYFR